ncbi:hypothetical protein RJ639_041531 [Escallonia herrerae]|uniref:Plastid lipid-associated protein/fibrillin conserved domain-containing protein n=1 Tax=Escallonia herrerae TaxID=1293975 RepID=A0AA89B2B2_9ASTE|nr:hypothetical protein RJ639_041531 [Escallonia herrerae]
MALLFSSHPSLLTKNPTTNTTAAALHHRSLHPHSLSFPLLHPKTRLSTAISSTSSGDPFPPKPPFTRENDESNTPPNPPTDEWGEKAEPETEPSTKLADSDPPKNEDEWGPAAEVDDYVTSGNGSAGADADVAGGGDDKVGELKRCLVDSVYGTELGFRASAEVRAEVLELVVQLEAANPTPAPTEAAELLDGNWVLVYGVSLACIKSGSSCIKILLQDDGISDMECLKLLVEVGVKVKLTHGKCIYSARAATYTDFALYLIRYTAFSELLPLLAAGTTPLLKVKKICQEISTSRLVIENSTTLSSPFATFSFSASANFEVRSPSRIQVEFKEGILRPPEIKSSVNLPENVDVFGQKINLSPVQQSLNPLQDALSGIAHTISGQPPLKIPIPGERTKSWLLITYLDKDFRISRGDGGLFVLAKEGSPLLDL